LFFPKTYKMRIQMAVMHWNENRDLLRRELPRRDEPKKGKRARGRMRSIPMEEERTSWRTSLCDRVVKSLKT
jgi:hypothetical protein